MYRILFRLLLSRMDPENAHAYAFRVIRFLARSGLGRILRPYTRPSRAIAVETLGLTFPSPFGLAAGFDKDGEGIRGLGQLGFGHVEVGTLTALPQPGNARPRLFRLVEDRAVINRMGFNNRGAANATGRLLRERNRGDRPVMGVNIGKSRVVDVADAVDDYVTSTRLLAPLADYLVVNVSSPNTPGLRGLQEMEQLTPLLKAVHLEAGTVPLLVKIAPDLSDDHVTRVAELAVELELDGIIATNTTVSRAGLTSDPSLVAAAGEGGLSGAPLASRSLEVLRLVRQRVPREFCVVSVGGVSTPADVIERLNAGATLVQGYTGFLYEGPLWAHRINRALTRRAKELAKLSSR